jgi:hypothetical protein
MQNQKFAVQRKQLPRLDNDFFTHAGITRAEGWLLSAMRSQLGGHLEKSDSETEAA